MLIGTKEEEEPPRLVSSASSPAFGARKSAPLVHQMAYVSLHRSCANTPRCGSNASYDSVLKIQIAIEYGEARCCQERNLLSDPKSLPQSLGSSILLSRCRSLMNPSMADCTARCRAIHTDRTARQSRSSPQKLSYYEQRLNAIVNEQRKVLNPRSRSIFNRHCCPLDAHSLLTSS